MFCETAYWYCETDYSYAAFCTHPYFVIKINKESISLSMVTVRKNVQIFLFIFITFSTIRCCQAFICLFCYWQVMFSELEYISILNSKYLWTFCKNNNVINCLVGFIYLYDIIYVLDCSPRGYVWEHKSEVLKNSSIKD